MADSSNKADSPVALVVDDDAITRLLIRRLMERMGFAVIEATDGEKALSEFSRARPTIVITDVRMPNMDGLTASAEMRKLSDAKDIPIIVMSGIDDRKVIKQAYELGVTTFLKKPINLSEFRNAVSAALPSADPSP